MADELVRPKTMIPRRFKAWDTCFERRVVTRSVNYRRPGSEVSCTNVSVIFDEGMSRMRNILLEAIQGVDPLCLMNVGQFSRVIDSKTQVPWTQMVTSEGLRVNSENPHGKYLKRLECQVYEDLPMARGGDSLLELLFSVKRYKSVPMTKEDMLSMLDQRGWTVPFCHGFVENKEFKSLCAQSLDAVVIGYVAPLYSEWNCFGSSQERYDWEGQMSSLTTLLFSVRGKSLEASDGTVYWPDHENDKLRSISTIMRSMRSSLTGACCPWSIQGGRIPYELQTMDNRPEPSAWSKLILGDDSSKVNFGKSECRTRVNEPKLRASTSNLSVLTGECFHDDVYPHEVDSGNVGFISSKYDLEVKVPIRTRNISYALCNAELVTEGYLDNNDIVRRAMISICSRREVQQYQVIHVSQVNIDPVTQEVKIRYMSIRDFEIFEVRDDIKVSDGDRDDVRWIKTNLYRNSRWRSDFCDNYGIDGRILAVIEGYFDVYDQGEHSSLRQIRGNHNINDTDLYPMEMRTWPYALRNYSGASICNCRPNEYGTKKKSGSLSRALMASHFLSNMKERECESEWIQENLDDCSIAVKMNDVLSESIANHMAPIRSSCKSKMVIVYEDCDRRTRRSVVDTILISVISYGGCSTTSYSVTVPLIDTLGSLIRKTIEAVLPKLKVSSSMSVMIQPEKVIRSSNQGRDKLFLTECDTQIIKLVVTVIVTNCSIEVESGPIIRRFFESGGKEIRSFKEDFGMLQSSVIEKYKRNLFRERLEPGELPTRLSSWIPMC